MALSSRSSPAIRTDIQALRGVAVVLVVLYHAGLAFQGAGYLGVDVFFVISGFLITGMIAARIDRGDFSFSEFYFRRARRLLPAAYATFTLTSIAAVYLLDVREWRDYIGQLIGAVTFTGNFALWQQAGYFSGDASLKPLLHIWTLAIEEQYYLLVPAALVLIPRRLWLLTATGVVVISLALHAHWAASNPEAAFYLLPTRAWELGLGSVAALLLRHDLMLRRPMKLLFWPALAALVVVPAWPTGLASPLDNFLVCFATLVVIMRHHPVLQAGTAPRLFAWIGDFSYSLYLVHWPIFAFMANARAGDPDLGARSTLESMAAVLASVLISYALYRGIEQPVRISRFDPTPGLVAATVAYSLLLVATPIAALQWTIGRSGIAFSEQILDRSDNVGFSERCDYYQRFDAVTECQNSDRPRLMVWGDSFAMHLVPGIALTTRAGVIQATKSSCGPLIGMAQVTREHPIAHARDCLSFNDSVIEYLAASESIEVVVLSSPIYPYLDRDNRRLLLRIDGEDAVAPLREPSSALALVEFVDTIQRLRALGKRVVVVAPPPSTGLDFSHCLERQARARTLYAASGRCSMRWADYRASKREVIDFLDQLAGRADVAVVDFDRLLCNTDECVTALDGVFLYRDEGHFSQAGSRHVGMKLGLGELLLGVAR